MANSELANLYLIKRVNGAYSEIPAEEVGLAVGKSGALNFSFENFSVKTELSGIGAVILGGTSNSSLESFATTLGGIYNRASGEYSSLGGGEFNTIKMSGATMFGGVISKIDNFRLSAFGGGPYSPTYRYPDNTASTMLNAELSFMTSKAGFIGGGSRHDSMGNFAAIGGGSGNGIGGPGQEIGGGPSFGTIFGGHENGIGKYAGQTDEGYGSTIIGMSNSYMASNLGVSLGKSNCSFGGNNNVFFGASNSTDVYGVPACDVTFAGFGGLIIGTGSTIAGGNTNKVATQRLQPKPADWPPTWIWPETYSLSPTAYSTVFGGLGNLAGEDYSLVFGGMDNYTCANFGYIIGGLQNKILEYHTGAALLTENFWTESNLIYKTSTGAHTLNISFRSGVHFRNPLFFKRINPVESADTIIRASGRFV